MADTDLDVLPLEDAKLHLRIDGDEEDSLVEDAIAAAIAYVEDKTVLILAQREVIETVDGFGRSIILDAWPVQSIDEIAYFDRSGAAQALLPGAFWANLSARPVRLRPIAGTAWPAAVGGPGSVLVKMTAGFELRADVPATVIQALKLLVSHFYRNRAAAIAGTSAAAVEMPLGVRALLRKWWKVAV